MFNAYNVCLETFRLKKKIKNLSPFEKFLRYKTLSVGYPFTWGYILTHTIETLSIANNIKMKCEQNKKKLKNINTSCLEKNCIHYTGTDSLYSNQILTLCSP